MHTEVVQQHGQTQNLLQHVVAGGKLQNKYPEQEALHAAKVRSNADDFYEIIDGSAESN